MPAPTRPAFNCCRLIGWTGARRRDLCKRRKRTPGFLSLTKQRPGQLGEGEGLIPVGTVRLIARLSLEGQAEDARSLVRRLGRDLTARVSDDIVEHAITIAAIPISCLSAAVSAYLSAFGSSHQNGRSLGARNSGRAGRCRLEKKF